MLLSKATCFTGLGCSFLPRPAGRDRKSTRLNSSHVRISYAVFCLKKMIYRLHEHLPPALFPAAYGKVPSFGNLGDVSETGLALTRHPATSPRGSYPDSPRHARRED